MSSVGRPSTCTSPLRARRCVASPTDLGIERGTLRALGRLFGTGKKTTADGTVDPQPARAQRRDRRQAPVPGETPEAGTGPAPGPGRSSWRRRTAKLVTEREILRQAAKYFAGETNW